MQSNISTIIEYIIEYEKNLHEIGYLPGPYQSLYGSKNFIIYAKNNCQITLYSFWYINSKCRIKFPIRINSFFSKYNHKSLLEIS